MKIRSLLLDLLRKGAGGGKFSLIMREKLRLLAILKLFIPSLTTISLLRSIILMSETESETAELTLKKWRSKLQQQRNSYSNVRWSSPAGKSLCV
jgi:hypothetical protein